LGKISGRKLIIDSKNLGDQVVTPPFSQFRKNIGVI
jgi:hypothetical protein